jgi:DNA-binding transcriptional LysR family regulator
MDLLDKMATYVRVVEAGSFSAAAKQLRISSGAVSRQIATLEEDLRRTLLRRSTRRMEITPVGRRYYESCLRVLREVEEAQATGRGTSHEGPLQITAPVTFGLERVVPHVAGLMTKHPGLRLDLRLEDRLLDLALEGVDVAIRVGNPPAPTADVVAHLLASFRRLLVASPAYLTLLPQLPPRCSEARPTSQAAGASREPSGERVHDGDAEGNDRVGEVSLRPRLGADRFDAAFGSGGEMPSLVRQRGRRSRPGHS